MEKFKSTILQVENWGDDSLDDTDSEREERSRSYYGEHVL